MSFLFYRKKFVWTCCFVLTGVFVALYIFQVNALVAMAYHIAGEETQIRQMKEETKTLQTNANKVLSLKDLEGLAVQLHFEKIRSITYLRLIEGAVAQSENRE